MSRDQLLALRDALARAWRLGLGYDCARERASNAVQGLLCGTPDGGLAAHLRTELAAARLPQYGGLALSDAQIDALVLAGCAAIAETLLSRAAADGDDLLTAVLSVPGIR